MESVKGMESWIPIPECLECSFFGFKYFFFTYDWLISCSQEAIKKIYSWQYAQCIDIWVLFISTNANESDIQPLLHLIIELINGISNLFPRSRYIPLRTRCIQWLNKLSNSCGIFIPVASLILDMLEYKVSKEGSKSRKSVKLASNLKVSY